MRYRYLILLLIYVFPQPGVVAQEEVPDISDKVSLAIRNGDAKELAIYFNQKIELVILERKNVYSKTQASMIMKSFFDDNKPQSFRIIHQGGKVDANFVIGLYNSGSDIFRFYLLIKTVENTPRIHQLRIEKENGHSGSIS